MSDALENERPKMLVFSTVESKVSRYFLLLPDGTRKPDNEMRAKVRQACTSFLRFFSENGLLNKAAFDNSGNLIDEEYRFDDLTEEGHKMLQKGAEKWLDSKSAEKMPPNYSKLNKILLEIRS